MHRCAVLLRVPSSFVAPRCSLATCAAVLGALGLAAGLNGQVPQNFGVEPAGKGLDLQYANATVRVKPSFVSLPSGAVVSKDSILEDHQNRPSSSVWPVPDWQRASSPEEAGMSRAGLDRYVSWLRSKAEGEPFGTIIVRSGKIVREYYGSGADAGSKWDIGSIRKSVASALLGIAIAEKKLSLDTVVYDVWPGIFRITGAEKDKQIRMLHLATNTSGWMTGSGPGEVWLYSNAACTAGHIAIARAFGAGDQVAPVVMERIAKAIGASRWDAYHYEEPFVAGKYGQPGPKLAIDSTLRDLARFAYLWLRDGEWNGKQVVPREYVRAGRQNQLASLGAHYGYWWFTNDGKVRLPDAPEDAFYNIGNGRGQRGKGGDGRRTICLIIPSLDLIAIAGTGAKTYNLSENYTSLPFTKVNEWIRQILLAVEDKGRLQ